MSARAPIALTLGVFLFGACGGQPTAAPSPSLSHPAVAAPSVAATDTYSDRVAKLYDAAKAEGKIVT